MFPLILKLHVRPGSKIADVTFGKGSFWNRVNPKNYELIPSDLTTGTDFRNLPYESGSFDVVVLDPPYIYNPKGTIKSSISNQYNINQSQPSIQSNDDVIKLYIEGIFEAQRVLKSNGFLILKCQDVIESGKQKWNHIDLYLQCTEIGFTSIDLFVVTPRAIPTSRWKNQKHARKNHSYFWIMKKHG